MSRRLIGPDEVRTFEKVERAVASNPRSRAIDRVVAGLGERLLGAIEGQFKGRGRREPLPVAIAELGNGGDGSMFKLPGRYVDVSFRSEEYVELALPSMGAQAIIDRAIERLFGRTRVSDLSTVKAGIEGLYILEYAGNDEGIGALHGVRMGHIDRLADGRDSPEDNYFQRSMMSELDPRDSSFMKRGGERASHMVWGVCHGRVAESDRGNVVHVAPLLLDEDEAINVIRVDDIDLEEGMVSLRDLSREIAVQVGAVARVRDSENPRRRKRHA